jgi:hypothetical protein
VSITLFTLFPYPQYIIDSSKGSPSGSKGKWGHFTKPTSAVGSSLKTTMMGVCGIEDDSASFCYNVICLGLNFTTIQYQYWTHMKGN